MSDIDERKKIRDKTRELKSERYEKRRDNLIKYITKRKGRVRNLFFRFLLLCIILIIFFVSLSLYGYDYRPIVLTKFQYSYYKNEENLPPGITTSGTAGSDIGKNFLAAQTLGKCPAGYCAISKETGLKRCPDGNYQIVYNTNQEACTRSEFCDLEEFKYAVLTDGTTDPNGSCDPGVPCRCTNQKRCNTGIISSFGVEFGSEFDPTQSNFTLSQIPDSGDMFGYSSIVLTQPLNQFCKINPAFTNKFVDGCEFTNATNDKLFCQQISSSILSPAIENVIFTVLRKKVNPGDTTFLCALYGDHKFFPIEKSTGAGYLQFTKKDGNVTITETISYQSFTPRYYNATGTVFGVVHLGGTGGTASTYGTPGFANSWEVGDKTQIFPIKVKSINCSVASDGPNYKNMLICTQQDNQPCLNGSLSYNFDKLNSDNVNTNDLLTDESFIRNFCQQRSNTQDSVIRSSYLQDPAFYTMSCYLGNGCNNKILNLNNLEGSKAAAGKYFPDVDVDGIEGIWDVVTTFPNFDGKSSLPNGSLLKENIQPGDFWSVKSTVNTMVTTREFIPEDGSTANIIYVNSLLRLESYVGLGILPEQIRPMVRFNISSSFTIKIEECGYSEDGQAFIKLDNNIEVKIPANTSLTVFPLDLNGITGFPKYGIIVKNENTEKYQFRDIDGNPVPKVNDDVNIPITIYKQFAFSGGNYNTFSYFNTITNKTTLKRRLYTKNGENPIKTLEEKPKEIIPPQDIYQLEYLRNKNISDPDYALQDPNTAFKKSLSMYYPVWNPATFQQECVRCKPDLIAYVDVGNAGDISDIVIQYCGKDFLNYEYNKPDNNFVFTSFSEFDTSKQNTTGLFNLKESNPRLEIGDYVMSPDLAFPVFVSADGPSSGFTNSLGSSLVIKPQITYSNSEEGIVYGLEESMNQRVTLPSNPETPNPTEIKENGELYIIADAEGIFRIDKDKSVGADGYCFGKKYMARDGDYDIKIGFYLIPITSVTDISEDGKTVKTDTLISKNIVIDEKSKPFSKYIQFCRLNRSLRIDLVQNLENNLVTTGFGEVININSITDGRITSIVVEEGGKDYLELSKPTVIISNYDYYV
jgi:hypothetical protein